MVFNWDLTDFDPGLRSDEIPDAQNDVQQSILQLSNSPQCPVGLAGIRGVGNFIIKVSGTFDHRPNDPPNGWGNATFLVLQVQNDLQRSNGLGGPMSVFAPRKEVWKQFPRDNMPLNIIPDPQKVEDWTIQPSPMYIQKHQYKQPVVEWSQKTNGKDSLDKIPKAQWDSTWALVGVAISQPHFRFFSNVMIRALGNHDSPSDRSPHATVKLINEELKNQGMIVRAHIYHDKNLKYSGHRIFVGSAVVAPWIDPV